MEVEVEVVLVLVEVEVDVVEVLVEVEVEVDVLVDVVEVESITKVLVTSIVEPCASTTFPVNLTVPKAFWSNGTVKLIEFWVNRLEFIRENMMFEVSVFVTRKL